MAASRRGTLTFSVEGPIGRDDLPGLCARICSLLTAHEPEVAICEVAGIEPDAVTVEALSRLQLGAARFGCKIYLRNASPELLELVAFMGLADVLGIESGR